MLPFVKLSVAPLDFLWGGAVLMLLMPTSNSRLEFISLGLFHFNGSLSMSMLI